MKLYVPNQRVCSRMLRRAYPTIVDCVCVFFFRYSYSQQILTVILSYYL